MPEGKLAGVRCAQLTEDNRCAIFGRPDRPEICNRLRPMAEMCGENFEDAMRLLEDLEKATAPARNIA